MSNGSKTLLWIGFLIVSIVSLIVNLVGIDVIVNETIPFVLANLHIILPIIGVVASLSWLTSNTGDGW